MEEEVKISKHSSGVSIIIRLDGLWKEVNRYATANRYTLWNSVLDRIWAELARDIKPSEFDDETDKEGKVTKGYKTKFDEFDTKIAEVSPSFNDDYENTNGFQNTPKIVLDNRAKHYKILMEKELFLRRLENHLGKGTTWDDEDDDGFD